MLLYFIWWFSLFDIPAAEATQEVLDKLESVANKMHMDLDARGTLLRKFQKWQALISDYHRVDAESKDPNRLKNRGGGLLALSKEIKFCKCVKLDLFEDQIIFSFPSFVAITPHLHGKHVLVITNSEITGIRYNASFDHNFDSSRSRSGRRWLIPAGNLTIPDIEDYTTSISHDHSFQSSISLSLIFALLELLITYYAGQWSLNKAHHVAFTEKITFFFSHISHTKSVVHKLYILSQLLSISCGILTCTMCQLWHIWWATFNRAQCAHCDCCVLMCDLCKLWAICCGKDWGAHCVQCEHCISVCNMCQLWPIYW